jgi:PAS domain S-box-containing protein
VRAEDEQTLLDDICRIVCDEAGYLMTWVGYAEDDDARTIRPVARAGVDDGYLEQAGINWADTERGRGASGTAIRSGESVCIQDFTADPHAAPWLDGAVQRGYRSSIALPLKDEHAHSFGVLNIYSGETDAFIPDEIRLLEELAGDLAFGIIVLRARIERNRAEETLRNSERLLAEIIDFFPDAILAIDQDKRITIWNRAIEQMTGIPAAEMIGKGDYLYTIPFYGEARPQLMDLFWKSEHEIATRYPILKREGDTLVIEVSCPALFGGKGAWVWAKAAPLRDNAGNLVGAIESIRDIADRKRAEEDLLKLNEELEHRVQDRTTELERKNRELERMNKLFVGRELRMVELKERIMSLEKKTGG